MDNEIKMKLTTKEAIDAIKKAPVASKFCLHFNVDIHIVDSEAEHYPSGGFSWVTLSRNEALRVVGDILTERLEQKGGRIKISTTKREGFNGKPGKTTYWIC